MRPTPHGTQIQTASTPSRGNPRGARLRPPALHHLTPQERNLLVKVAQGLRDDEIAADMFIAKSTVGAIIDRIRGKTGTKSRLTLVIYAYEQGYVVPRYVEERNL